VTIAMTPTYQNTSIVRKKCTRIWIPICQSICMVPMILTMIMTIILKSTTTTRTRETHPTLQRGQLNQLHLLSQLNQLHLLSQLKQLNQLHLYSQLSPLNLLLSQLSHLNLLLHPHQLHHHLMEETHLILLKDNLKLLHIHLEDQMPSLQMVETNNSSHSTSSNSHSTSNNSLSNLSNSNTK